MLNSADQTDLPRLRCSFLVYINPAAIYENLLEMFYIQRAEDYATALVSVAKEAEESEEIEIIT